MSGGHDSFAEAWQLLKWQTSLPQFDASLSEDTGYAGVPPVQQMSAQPLRHMRDYLQGEYPPDLWTAVGDDPEITRDHGSSRHRVDDQGRYLAVGVRGEQPIGDLPTTGPFRPRKGRPDYPQDRGVRVVPREDMPDTSRIVTIPMRGGE